MVLLLYGELEDAARRGVEAHAHECAGCGAILAEERRLSLLLSQREGTEPSAYLLRRCRADLAAAIAAETAPAARAWRPAWVTLSPVGAAVILAVGFLAGRFLPPLGPERPGRVAGLETPAGEAGSTVAGVSDLEADPESDRISLSYDVLRRASLQGSTKDPRIRRLLVETVRDSLNAGLRLEALLALSRQVEEEDARAALLRAVSEDDNPGARLMAVGALGRLAGRDAEVRGALVRALLSDGNPGVRVRAIDVLGEARSPETFPLFERLSREDPNDYVRLRSAAFVNDRPASGGIR
jgi:hypothetical protein